MKSPLGNSDVFVPPEEQPVPGECSPKSDTTLKRSMSLCQDDENEKMPTYNAEDDITPLEEPPNITPTPAIPVSGSFDSSESEVIGTPDRITPKEQQEVTIVEEDPEGATVTKDHESDEKLKIGKRFVGRKFQHYTRVPQLRKDVRMFG